MTVLKEAELLPSEAASEPLILVLCRDALPVARREDGGDADPLAVDAGAELVRRADEGRVRGVKDLLDGVARFYLCVDGDAGVG